MTLLSGDSGSPRLSYVIEHPHGVSPDRTIDWKLPVLNSSWAFSLNWASIEETSYSSAIAIMRGAPWTPSPGSGSIRRTTEISQRDPSHTRPLRFAGVPTETRGSLCEPVPQVPKNLGATTSIGSTPKPYPLPLVSLPARVASFYLDSTGIKMRL